MQVEDCGYIGSSCLGGIQLLIMKIKGLLLLENFVIAYEPEDARF
jgi:hypothetical protein